MALIVLDRDGVINQDSDDYIRSLEEWHPIPGSIEAIAALSEAGYQVAIATNQSGLSRGYFDLDELERMHAHLRQLVEERGGAIAGIFYCPHLPEEGCDCRKPGTGLLQAIESELGESPRGCFFVGDSLKDLQAARSYGCRPLLVETGKGAGTARQLRSGNADIDEPGKIPIYRDLAAAATDILQGADDLSPM